RVCGHIMNDIVATLRAFAILEYAHSARGNIAGVEAREASVAHLEVEAEPVGAEHAAGSIEGHRRRNLPFKICVHTGEQPLADVVGPSHAADKRVVQEPALRWDCMRELTQLNDLQQD